MFSATKGGSPSGYQISRSVRLRSSASAYFNRTPASAGNRKTWTWSGWVKRGTLGTVQIFTSCHSATTDASNMDIGFYADDTLRVVAWTTTYRTTTQVFRDPSAWYHLMIVIDTTQATANDRVKLYVNGTQVTVFTTTNNPTQNSDIGYNQAATTRIGSSSNAVANLFDGYLTEINFIDGQALTPSSFGETDVLTGVWQPKKYAGTYGTNGFYLNFSDNTGATATTIGKDYSGNGNNWTPNNISLTAGATYDSMIDVPTQFADGGNGRGNYCVINPLGTGVPSFKNSTSLTISNGNLSYSKPSATGYFGALGTFAMPPTGKWYWEFTPTTNVITCGISVGADYASSGEFGVRVDNTSILVNGSSVQTGLAGLAVNDVIGCAWNADSNSFQFYKNGSTYGTAVSFTPASGASYYPYLMNQGTGLSVVANANFGQRPFSYTPPTGFKALNTLNLPQPTILKGNQYFDATLYTGNNSTLSVTNSGSMQPDLVWIKGRSQSSNNVLQDAVRGANRYLISNGTGAEGTDGSVTAFNSNGFSLTTDAGVSFNANGTTYVGWQWKANGTPAVTNTAGSITSTISAGTTQGFSIVTYTGTGTTGTVGHGLGVVPNMIIVKERNRAVEGWPVYTTTTGNANALFLNTTGASTAVGAWNSTTPTSTVFTVGGGSSTNLNGSTTYVAYCFASVAGYSRFGSYTGNGSADGTFVYTGFRPRYIMIKRTDSTGDWNLIDTSRSTYNQTNNVLWANLSDADSAGQGTDILSNGFKLRSTGLVTNASGGTYIYAAFAESPFKNALAR
jgi:hypothetical protein